MERRRTLVDLLPAHAREAHARKAELRREKVAYHDALSRWWGTYRWHLFVTLKVDPVPLHRLRGLVREQLDESGPPGVYAMVTYQRGSTGYLHAHLLIGHPEWRGVVDGLHLALQRRRWEQEWRRLCARHGVHGSVWMDRFRPARTADGRHVRGVSYIARNCGATEAAADVLAEGEWDIIGRPKRRRIRHHGRRGWDRTP